MCGGILLIFFQLLEALSLPRVAVFSSLHLPPGAEITGVGVGGGGNCSGGEERLDLVSGDLGLGTSSVTIWITFFKSHLSKDLDFPICKMG